MESQSDGDSTIGAVFFDFGGVVLTSPFDAFNNYERTLGIPEDSIRMINATNPDDNAWARFERSEVDKHGFAELFEVEAAQRGFEISGTMVLKLISGEVRPEMVEAIRRVRAAGLLTACLTNNFRRSSRKPDEAEQDNVSEHQLTEGESEAKGQAVSEALAMFDHLIESSVIGVRKPEPEFYKRALEVTGVSADQVVFLDDLGINLKPAKAMGMTTIKVVDPDVALAELEKVIGLPLRS